MEFFVISDPDRRNEIDDLANNLPKNSFLIIRHFGTIPEFEPIKNAKCGVILSFDTRLINHSRMHQFHLPAKSLRQFYNARTRQRILTASAHNFKEIHFAAKLGIKFIIVSKIFKSLSQGAGKPMGVQKFARLVRQLKGQKIIALGGINRKNYGPITKTKAAGIAGVGFE